LDKDIYALTKANCHYIITFWDNLYEKLVSEKIIENFQQIPELIDRLKVLEADVKKPLYTYRDEILKKQEEKEQIIKSNLDLIEANLEEMGEKSKEEIHSFKKRFREFLKSNPDNFSEENIEKHIKLKELKEKLYEIELFNKVETEKKISDLKGFADNIVDRMREDTKTM
jgi:uncharacterized protein YbcC (UPF0753/DUF2309 family)